MDQLRRLGKRNRSETHLTTTLEHSEQEHDRRSQTPISQSNHRSFFGRVKDSFTSQKTRQSHDTSGPLATVNPSEDQPRSFIDRVKGPSTPEAPQSYDSSVPPFPVNPTADNDLVRSDQDAIEGISSNLPPSIEDKNQSSARSIKLEMVGGRSSVPVLQVDKAKSNQETPPNQLTAPDLATVVAARNAANTSISEMKGLALPVQTVASAISKTDNPINLVDLISSFLKTLSRFNSAVDKIAKIHPYAQAAWTVLSLVSKIIIEQATLDDSVASLLKKMDEIYTFLTTEELREIESMKTVVEQICHQTLECSYFIREYCQNAKFRTRLIKNLFSETDTRVQNYNNVFDELLQQFRDRAVGDTLVVVHQVWEKMDALAQDSDLNSMPYVGGAGLDTQKICLDGTREKILDDITEWINNTEDHASRVFWLHGNAGTGKSSIAHTIADRFNKLGRLGSCYCFDRNKIAEERHKKIFTVIAQDLARTDKQIRSELAAAVHLDKSLKNTTDILQQWKELIMKPANKLSEAMVGPIVIVIDALDESGGADSRQYLLRILAGNLSDDKSHISKLPPHVRILLTSRGLPDIYNALNGVAHVRSMSMETITSTPSDILRYISEELKGIQIQDVSRRLADASDGLFEWARLACAYVKGDDVAGSDVKERFEDVITRNQDERVPLLDSMYKLTLELVFPADQYKRSRSLDQFRSVMAQILGLAEPLSLDALDYMRRRFIEDRLRETDVGVIVKPMGALLSGTTDSSAVIRPLHASFPEFLMDKNRSGEFFIDSSHIHNELAAASLGVMTDKLEFNICRFPSSYLANSEIPDLDQEVKRCISPELSYSCRFWTDHLRRIDFDVAIADAIRGFFNHERLLFWVEVLSLLKKINTCADSMFSVVQWVMGHPDYKDISDAAADVQSFIRIFGGPISFSTPHLYLSALPFSPRNSHISAKFRSKFAKVPDIAVGRIMNWPVIQGVLHGHSGSINSVVFSPDGKHIVSGSDDKTIRLWDAETRELVRPPLEGHENFVWSVAFSPHGKLIVSASSDKTIRVWDAETGELVRPPLKGHESSVRSVAFSPDGKWIVSGSDDKTIRLWDAEKGELVRPPLEGHEDSVRSVVFSPDGKLIASGSSDRTIRLWDTKIGELVRPPLEGHEDWVLSIAFSPDGQHIVSGSDDKTIRLWDTKTGELECRPLEGHEDSVRSVAFSPDGKLIASGSSDRTIRLWDAKMGELVQPSLEGQGNWDQDWVLSVAFSPDSKRIVSGSENKTIQLWDAGTRELVLEPPLEGHENRVLSVAFSPDGKHIVSGSDDKTIQLWDVETGKLVQPPLEGHKNSVRSVAFSPDGKWIVSGSDDKTICLWDAERGELVRPPLEGHEDSVRSVVFSPDGKHIASASSDKTIRLWDTEVGELVRPPLEGHEDWVLSIAFSPDGKYIVSGSYDKTIRLWDAETGELVRPPLEGHENWVRAVAFLPDGKCIVSGSYDKTIRLWDVKTGELVRPPLEGHEKGVLSVASSPDGKHIVSGSDDKTIQLWDVETGELVKPPMQGHEKSVRSVAFSPDGKRIVSGSLDKTIRLWDAGSMEEVMQPPRLTGQHLIRFSSHLEHALTITVEIASDLLEHPLTDFVKLTSLGWVHIGSKQKLLFWVPPTYHPQWYSAPNMQTVIPVSDVQIDLSQMAHGQSWELCYSARCP